MASSSYDVDLDPQGDDQTFSGDDIQTQDTPSPACGRSPTSRPGSARGAGTQRSRSRSSDRSGDPRPPSARNSRVPALTWGRDVLLALPEVQDIRQAAHRSGGARGPQLVAGLAAVATHRLGKAQRAPGSRHLAHRFREPRGNRKGGERPNDSSSPLAHCVGPSQPRLWRATRGRAATRPPGKLIPFGTANARP